MSIQSNQQGSEFTLKMFLEPSSKVPLFVNSDDSDNDGKIKNKFYLGLNTKSKITQKVERCLFFTFTGNDTDFLNKEYITEDEQRISYRNYCLIDVSSNVLLNSNHFENSIELTKEDLENYNSENILLHDTEIVIIMPNIRKEYVDKYKMLYKTETSFNDVFLLLSMYDYFNCSDNSFIVSKLFRTLSDTLESNYWKVNHKYSLDEQFQKRRLSDNTSDLNIIMSSKENNDLKKVLEKDVPYVIDFFTKSNVNKCNFTKETINETLRNIKDEKIKLALIANLLISKDLCHLVINNENLLMQESSLLYNFSPLIVNLLTYSTLTFYLEELQSLGNISLDDRFIFTLETASNLPCSPYNVKQIKKNPYCPVLVNNDKMKNLQPPMFIKNTFPKITDNKSFRDNLNIWTTKNPNQSILDGICWENLAMVGDFISACCKSDHTIETTIPFNMPWHIRKNRYFSEYYHDSKIDLLLKTNNIYEYIEKSLSILNTIQNNIKLCFGNDTYKNVEKQTEKELTVYLKKECADIIIRRKKCIQEEFKDNINSQKFKNEVYKLYILWKSDRDGEITDTLDSKGYKDYEFLLEAVTSDKMNIVIVNELPVLQTIKGSYNYASYARFFEETTYEKSDILIHEEFTMCLVNKDNDNSVVRPVTINHLSSTDFINYAASQTHGTSRGYYNGETVYMLPSCVYTLLVNISPDVRAFDKNPIDKLITNHVRGYGTVLNEHQFTQLTTYSSDFQFRNNIDTVSSIYFKSKYSKDSKEYEFVSKDNSISTEYDLEYEISSRCPYYSNLPFSNIITEVIKEDGTVNPFKSWILEAVIDSMK